jgi:hypothetical protein
LFNELGKMSVYLLHVSPVLKAGDIP